MTETADLLRGERWTDPDGHPWPITGRWCSICGLPRIDVGDGLTTHPTCEPEDSL